MIKEDYDIEVAKEYTTLQERIATLEKENKVLAQNLEDTEILNKTLVNRNAELRKDNSEWEKASDKWKSLYDLTNNQLTNAKEIIREFMKYEINEYDGSLEIHFEELKKQAEQFLKD